jgi:hypothetical protein
VESVLSLQLKSAEAEFPSLSIPTLTGGEFREGGLKKTVDKFYFYAILD